MSIRRVAERVLLPVVPLVIITLAAEVVAGDFFHSLSFAVVPSGSMV